MPDPQGAGSRPPSVTGPGAGPGADRSPVRAPVRSPVTIVIVVGLHAASVVRPHVLDTGAGVLRVRRAVQVDVRIPLERIGRVRRELRTSRERADGELTVDVGAQTSLTLELTEPVTHVSFFGRRREVRVVRCHADDADGLVRALAEARSALVRDA